MKTQNLPIVKSVLKWALLTVIPMLLLSAWAWWQLPAGTEIPMHWDGAGRITRYGGKLEGLFLLPAFTLAIAALFAFVPLIEPRQTNLLRSAKAYTLIVAGVMLLMLCLHVSIVMIAFDKAINVYRIIFVFMGFLFMVMGNVMGKIRSNFMVGVRTPWTLSSELSWNKTHRLAGRLFAALGLVAVLVAAMAPTAYIDLVVIGGLVIVAAVTIVYSYRVWKNDPNKQQAGGNVR